MALVTSILNGQGSPLPVNSNQQLADMLATLAFIPSPTTLSELASAATYTWTTAKSVNVTYAAGTCTITIPNETDTVSWPVGESRLLLKSNTSANVISFAALTNVSFNLAAVNTAIATLIGSAAIPGVATAYPCWRILRTSATAYAFFQGT